MDETRIQRLEDVGRFLLGGAETSLVLHGSKNDVYRWIEHTLVRFRYIWLGKADKGLILRYIEHLSGYSRQHVSKHRKTGRVRRSQRTANGFATKYTHTDIVLLAEVDRLVDDASGTMVKTFCQRMLNVYGDQRFVRIAGISVSHLYNLRKGKVYRRCRRTFNKTQGTKVNIGERCKPQPGGKPGHLRVDSVKPTPGAGRENATARPI